MSVDPDIRVCRGYMPEATIGTMAYSGGLCFTLELPDKNNQQDVSCIPEGIYPYRKAFSPNRKRVVIWIDDVPGRSAIQIHPGNYTRQILGCTLTGTSIRFLDGDSIPDVASSEDAFDALMREVPDTGFIEYYSIRP